MPNYIFEQETYAIRGAVFEVYRQLGCGFLENVYQECLEKEFSLRKLPFQTQPEVQLFYKAEALRQIYKPDFICFEAIIVELKALTETKAEHQAQLLNYLKATRTQLGLLVNFGAYPKATVQRIIL